MPLAKYASLLLLPCIAAAQTPAALQISGPISGLGQPFSLTADALHGMKHDTLTVTNGHTHAKETYTGVPLLALLQKAGAPVDGAFKGKALSDYVIATGSDGYKAVLALAEIEPGFHPGTVLVADTLDGKPLDAKQGPFKLVVSEDAKPSRAVHNLVKVELKQAE